MNETKSDAIVHKRDEVAAQLRRLADLVEHDRWEDAAKLHAVMQDGFTTCFTTWNALRFKRNLAKREAELGAELTLAGIATAEHTITPRRIVGRAVNTLSSEQAKLYEDFTRAFAQASKAYAP